MKGSNKEQQMGDVARRLKNIAKELDIWVIALSQLNRDRENPVPTMARLRDSGQIAEAADIVLLIYRPEYYGRQYSDEFSGIDTNGTALIDIAKGRNIGIGKFICGFEKETNKVLRPRSYTNRLFTRNTILIMETKMCLLWARVAYNRILCVSNKIKTDYKAIAKSVALRRKTNNTQINL